MKGHHGVVEDDSDAVVQEGLAEDEEVETHVDADLLENSQDGNLCKKTFQHHVVVILRPKLLYRH